MDRKRWILFGFTNAFRPARYANTRKYGDIAVSIDRQLQNKRKAYLGEIEKASSKAKYGY